MKEIKLKIQNAIDREKMVQALANSGYNVRIEEEEDKEWRYRQNYFVVFNI